MSRPSGRCRRLPLLSLASMVCAGALVLCAPALASTPAPGGEPAMGSQSEPVTDTPMGSQIRKHEGGEERALPIVDPLATVAGMDVSGHQGNVDWQSWWNQGMRFAYVKATENTNYKNPYFTQQYNGSYNVGMIRGAYHFALPDRSSGAKQANYFVDNGGGWSKDGKTLPGALDMEYNPYGETCYGLSKSQMTSWIKDFSDTYHSRTGRWPVIYTSTSWWNQCVDGDFSSTNPLWVAKYSSSVGTLPYKWGVWTIWQYTSSPIDKNTFNGAMDRLQALANG
ncbi:lysozyme [Saccharopolyspora sp. NPDC002376]